MSSLRLIGYWRSRFEVDWPDARDFVDRSWSTAKREVVTSYLARGSTLQQYRGLSPCRFCERHNGSKELTDGTYCWPEGLAHYIAEHDVRLPDEFVAHVESFADASDERPLPEFDHLGQRVWDGGYDDDYESWMARFAERFRAGDAEANWLSAEITDTWWLEQAGWTPSQSG